MNQRKMFDDEIQELTCAHSRALEKLKKLHGDEKQRLEQLVASLKEGGATKDSLRGTIEQCMYVLDLFLNFNEENSDSSDSSSSRI